MYPNTTLAELVAASSYAKRQEAIDPFRTDFILLMESIRVPPTVEQMLARTLASIEVLLSGWSVTMRIDDTYSFKIHAQGKKTFIEFFNGTDLIASIDKEEDVSWEIYGHLPKKVDLMKYEWPGWSLKNGSLEDQYVVMLKKVGALERAYRNVLK